MTLAQFAAMTMRVAAIDGLDAYLPTLAIIDTRQLVVLDAVPDDVAHTRALIDAITERGLGLSNFAFGVRTGDRIIIGRCNDGECEFGEIAESADGLVVDRTSAPAWWPFRVAGAPPGVGIEAVA